MKKPFEANDLATWKGFCLLPPPVRPIRHKRQLTARNALWLGLSGIIHETGYSAWVVSSEGARIVQDYLHLPGLKPKQNSNNNHPLPFQPKCFTDFWSFVVTRGGQRLIMLRTWLCFNLPRSTNPSIPSLLRCWLVFVLRAVYSFFYGPLYPSFNFFNF